MTDIKPRIENGEPVCSWQSCPSWGNKGDHRIGCTHLGILGEYATEGDPCIPALRQQRDEAMRNHSKVVSRQKAISVDWVGDWRDAASELYGPEAAARLFPEETR